MDDTGSDPKVLTARDAGLVACRRCARVWPAGTPVCERCGSRLMSRDAWSLWKVWWWWTAGVAAYIPANAYPMLSSRQLFFSEEVTILGSVAALFNAGSYFLAAVILIASILIPLAKFAIIALLALSVGRRDALSPGRRHRLYEVVELIGRWSMIDVFVVAILAALVRLSVLAEIVPGPASFAFALTVIFTMLSARSFDPRLIWDEPER